MKKALIIFFARFSQHPKVKKVYFDFHKTRNQSWMYNESPVFTFFIPFSLFILHSAYLIDFLHLSRSFYPCCINVRNSWCEPPTAPTELGAFGRVAGSRRMDWMDGCSFLTSMTRSHTVQSDATLRDGRLCLGFTQFLGGKICVWKMPLKKERTELTTNIRCLRFKQILCLVLTRDLKKSLLSSNIFHHQCSLLIIIYTV